MKNVRIWFRKDGACRFISHLDINRAMMRALKMSEVPLWHTEGYNSRLYISFALPLSLGFRGEYESMDVKFLEDDYPYEAAVTKINNCLPEGLTVYNITEPVMKPNDISYGLFEIKLTSEKCSSSDLFESADKILNQPVILVEKKSKKGITQINLKENIVKYELKNNTDYVLFNVILPAGNTVNINPALIVSVIEKEFEFSLFADITRKKLYDSDFNVFL